MPGTYVHMAGSRRLCSGGACRQWWADCNRVDASLTICGFSATGGTRVLIVEGFNVRGGQEMLAVPLLLGATGNAKARGGAVCVCPCLCPNCHRNTHWSGLCVMSSRAGCAGNNGSVLLTRVCAALACVNEAGSCRLEREQSAAARGVGGRGIILGLLLIM